MKCINLHKSLVGMVLVVVCMPSLPAAESIPMPERQ